MPTTEAQTAPVNPPTANATSPHTAAPAAQKRSIVETVTNDGRGALLALLRLEAEVRDVKSVRDLVLLMANETRKLTQARQIFVALPGLRGDLEIRAVSSLPVVDRTAPLITCIEDLLRANAANLGNECTLDLARAPDTATAAAYPFRALQWLPLKFSDHPARGGLLLARESAWSETDIVIPQRLTGAYAHALALLDQPRLQMRSVLQSLGKRHMIVAALTIAALCAIPVPLTALAPIEIVPRQSAVVAAPIDGVVDQIAVEPNQAVKPGDILVRFNNTTFRSKFDIASRDVGVAEARVKQANQAAFSDPRGLHELGIARAELQVKTAERDFAAEMLAKTEVRADSAGVAVFSDKREWAGRPMAIGERILEIAEPSAIEARIELPIADAMALTQGARVKLFLDSEPLSPWRATVKRADYKARVGENDVLAFRIFADLETNEQRALPRLGVRGTAQVSGDKVALGFFLFRRPITALRQWTGW